MSKDHVLVPVPNQYLGAVYAFIGVLEAGPGFSRQIAEFIDAPRRERAAQHANHADATLVTDSDLPDTDTVLDEATVDEQDPVDRLPEFIDIATEGQGTLLWEAMDTLGSQDQAQLAVLFERLCSGTSPASELDDIDGDYSDITWKRVKRLARACSAVGIRTPVRHSTTHGVTYVFFTGVRNGLDA